MKKNVHTLIQTCLSANQNGCTILVILQIRMLPRHIHIVPRLLYHNLIYALLYHVSLVFEKFSSNKVLVTTSLSYLQFNVLFLVGNHCCPCCCYFNFFFEYITNNRLLPFLVDSCHLSEKEIEPQELYLFQFLFSCLLFVLVWTNIFCP